MTASLVISVLLRRCVTNRRTHTTWIIVKLVENPPYGRFLVVLWSPVVTNLFSLLNVLCRGVGRDGVCEAFLL